MHSDRTGALAFAYGERESGHGSTEPYLARFTQRVSGLAAVPALLKQFDVEPGAVLRSVGLPRDVLDDPMNRILYADVGRILEECVARTSCGHFGFLVGRAISLQSLGLVGEMVRNSPTIGRALRTFSVHQQLNSEGAAAFLIERGSTVDFGYAIYTPAVHASEQIFDLVMAVALNIMRELCGPGFAPSGVLLPHAPPKEDGVLKNFFRAHMHYHSEICALRFPSRLLEQPVPGADPLRLRVAESSAAAFGHGALVPRVYRALRILLIHGKSCGDDVAAMLAMHRRTLNRRLEDEGTTFRQVLADVRFDVACQLLASTKLSVDDVAAAVAYDSVGSFMRSFKRWSGTTPGHFRREHAAPCARGWIRERSVDD